jgi:hypothetical protein
MLESLFSDLEIPSVRKQKRPNLADMSVCNGS